ncbi:Fur-regulated basic protein FbpA [Alkalihalobacterium elongatum]|uniref:Fur-regulated basic protein FbpA n=1 Tax=Alkalihalobacterium elongatum TaxID=2675466 RepID=UPI001C1F7995|nr:Fur-regulated basic protein FbpA [Alkalihalobacterium elongatum]
MSFTSTYSNDKEHLIDSLIKHQHYKMPDGRQFYQATEQELKLLLCSQQKNQYHFCNNHEN